MKNKNLFFEWRFLYKDEPPEGGGSAGSASKDKAKEDELTKAVEVIGKKKFAYLITEVDKVFPFRGGKKPESIFENNPFFDQGKNKFLTQMSELTTPDHPFKKAVFANGSLELEYEKGGKLNLDSEACRIIFWKEIENDLKEIFKKSGAADINETTIRFGAVKSEKLGQLIDQVARNLDNVKTDEKLVKETIEDLKSPKFRDEVKKESERRLTELRGGAERGKLILEEGLPARKPPMELPTEATMPNEEFLKQVDDVNKYNKLDRLKINVNREAFHINAQKWDSSTIDGLKKIYQDMRDLDIPVTEPFYQKMFFILKSGADPANPHLAQHKSLFLNPANNRDEIAGLPAQGVFLGGEQYMKAYEQLQYIQGVLLAQDQAQVTTLKKEHDLDTDPVGTKITDFVKSNLATFQNAIRERDYATAGIYAVGIYALYQAYKKLSDGKDTAKKWIIYGAAIYAGNIFLKNAGYDVLKMAGFRDPDYEVKGTPMQVMKNILSKNPALRDQTKDMDYGLVLRMSDEKLTSLEKFYQDSNTNGVQFIHPKEFPDVFPPDLVNQWPFDMRLGEAKSTDHSGKFSPGQREYIRVGQQLYKMAVGLRGIYDETLRKDHPDYKGILYEDAIKDETRKLGKVRHLLDAVSPYAVANPSEGLFSKRKTEEVEAGLRKSFNAKDSAFIESKLGDGHYKGKLMDYPVVFVLDGNKYRVYLVENYGQTYNSLPGTDFSAEIPADGGSEKDGKGAIDAVRNRVVDLLRPVSGTGKDDFIKKNLKYENGKWRSKIKFPGVASFDVDAREEEGLIEIYPDGKGVGIITKNGVRLNLNEEMAKQNPIEFVLSERIVNQPKFRALKVFSNARQIDASDVDQKDKTLTLLVGKSKLNVKLKYDGSKFNFVDPADEQKLVQDKAFAEDYIDSLNNDSLFEFNKTIDGLKKLLKESCPEGFLMFFFKSLAGQTARGELSGFNTDVLSGSIPDNFANMVMDSTRNQAFDQLRNKMLGATGLAKVENFRKAALQDTNTELQSIYDSISKENRELLNKGEDWKRMDFMLKVVDRLRGAACVSTQYQLQRSDMESMAYKMNLPGLAAASDFNEVSHVAAGKLVNVFTHYTAHLDDRNLDGLKWPPTPSADYVSNPKADPDLRGHYALNYFEYVKDRIANEAPKITGGKSLSPTSIPHPSDPRWQIEDFDSWLNNRGRYDALDPLDNGTAFKHELTEHDAGKHTQLDEELKKKLTTAKELLLRKCSGDINPVALDDYFNKFTDDPDAIEEMGLFVIHDDPTTVKPTSALWEDTDGIARVAGDRRSVQIRMMNQRVEEFISYVFTQIDPDNGKLKFFFDHPGIWEKIKVWYTDVKYDIIDFFK